ncbi:MAG: YgiQ family radical SAM protein [Clostridia bacterium]|nr:YgiQ family radical SAM protein [Clostridia bacterium]MDY4083812.1 YgiQ family radical SAM protein [Eubacteriales bacterium]
MAFLPTEKHEVSGRVDLVYVIGEAYVDHPSFGHAIISRLIQSMGLSIAIITQPQKDEDYRIFGEPKMGFLVSSGVVDSMVNNYTVAKIRRSRDVYSEGGQTGLRPDRAVDVYCNTLKRLYPDSAIVIGGIEASLRRFAHYDYWADKVLPSILVSSQADLLIYGMGERPIKEICNYLKRGVPLSKIKDVRGTCYLADFDTLPSKIKEDVDNYKAVFCESYEAVKSDKLAYVRAFNTQTKTNDHAHGKVVLQKHGDKYLVQNPMQLPMSSKEMDEIYALPYERTYHPKYTKGVPAIEEVKYSITSVRGCYGNCNYCAIAYHQGRVVQKRSKESIVQEAVGFTKDADFKGYIHDVGGPTANFRDPACAKQWDKGVCPDRQCIGYKPCPNLKVDHSEYLDLLRTLRKLEGVKKVFIRSGIRYDYAMYDESDEFIEEIIKYHVSGQLKVAPEHVSDNVLKNMNKPNFDLYLKFKKKFDDINKKLGKKQYLVPYLISSHPGCTLDDAINLALYLKSIGYMPEQVQDFYPTPSTKSTCMYYTGINPDTMQEVYVPRSKREKQLQRALMQYRKKENYNLVKEALIEAGRQDLIGFKDSCLIKPLKEEAKSGYLEQKPKNANGKKAVKTRSGVVYVDQAKIDKINSDKKRAKGKSTPKKRGKK